MTNLTTKQKTVRELIPSWDNNEQPKYGSVSSTQSPTNTPTHSPTEPVSEGCDVCGLLRSKSPEMFYLKGDKICKKCIDKNMANPPTETGVRLMAGQIQMLKEAGISVEQYQKAIVSVEEFCQLMGIRHPYNPPEPTVEKWESSFDEKFGYLKKCNCGGEVWHTDKEHIEEFEELKSFTRHSVQEAKAEGYQECLTELCKKAKKVGLTSELIDIIFPKLASLKQEEDK